MNDSGLLRRAALLTAGLVAAMACSGSSDPARPEPELADAQCPAGGEGGAGGGGESEGGAGGECRSGDTRCQGPTGYQQCQPDGTWSPPQSCAHYGTANHCLAITPEYAACVEPACWYWNVAGLLDDSDRVGVCAPDGGFQACSAGGTLASSSECAGACVTVTVINGSNVGFCRAECEDGEQECLGGPLYRECEGGRWQRSARLCADGGLCQPLAETPLPRIECGTSCTPGTSRCAAGLNAIEHCGDDGEFEAAEECASGVCQSKGVQAYCAPLCEEGQSSCAFDGALSARACSEPGQWSAEEPCATDTLCRQSGRVALGCVECVGPAAPGGNAWGVADSRCNGDSLADCGDDNLWQPASACGAGETCIQLSNGPSSLAYCAAAP